MCEIGFSDSTRQLIAIASYHAVRMDSTVLHTQHIEDIIFKRPDLFPDANYFEKYARTNLFVQFFGPDSMVKKPTNNPEEAIKELIWSKELHESILSATKKARELSLTEITPKLLLYGIFKNPDTQSHKKIAGKHPCGRLRLAKLVEDHFWRTGKDDAWVASVNGYGLFNQGDYQEALSFHLKAAEIDPEEPLHVYDIITCLQHSGRWSEALEYSEKLLKMAPNEIGCWVVKITSLYYMKRFKEALRACSQIPVTGMNNPVKDVYYQKGELLICLRKRRDALKCFDEALAIDPGFVDALLAKGSVLLSSDMKQAFHYIDRVLEIEPDNRIALQLKEKIPDWRIWWISRIVKAIIGAIFILIAIGVLYALVLSCL